MTREAALAIGEWLQQAGILEKRVYQLSLVDLESMAVACISRYVATRKKLSDEPPSPAGAGLSIGA